MDNSTIAKTFHAIADCLEILGENRFRVQAYRRAAETVESAIDDVATLPKQQLMDIPGIGDDLSDAIIELYKTGKSKEWEQLKKKVPEGLLDVLRVEGMGSKTTAFIWKKFGVTTIASLEQLLSTGKLEKMPGFGVKKIANIQRGIALYKKLDKQHPLDGILRKEEKRSRARYTTKRIEETDIRGDLHTHSHWSDGNETIETMVGEAKRRGYEYIAITDHASSMGMVRGIKPPTIKKYIREIRRAEQRIGGIKVLAGAEIDIAKDGSLYLSDSHLKKLDFVIASIHSYMKQDRATATARIIRAMENPFVHCIGHLTTRIIGRRAPIDFDVAAIMKAAKRTGTIMELNAQWKRLDLGDMHCRIARKYGVPIAINADAHTLREFAMMRYGIAIAQRAGLEKKDVVNTWSWKEFQKMLYS